MDKALLMHDYCLSPGSEEEAARLHLEQFIDYTRAQFEIDWEEGSISSIDSDLFPELSEMDGYLNLANSVWDFNAPASVASVTGEDSYLGTPGTPLEPGTPVEIYEGEDAWIQDFVKANGVVADDSMESMDYSTLASVMNESTFDFEEVYNKNGNDELAKLTSIAPTLVAPASLSIPVPAPVFIVAPATVQHVNVGTLPQIAMPAPRVSQHTRKRKEEHYPRDPLAIPVFEEIDIKPVLSQIKSQARAPKRTIAAAASSPSTSASNSVSVDAPNRKMKKYELEDERNPSVRNAKAAKANREKKKQAEAELRSTNERQAVEIAELKAQVAVRNQTISQLQIQLREEQFQRKCTGGLDSIKAELKDYLRTVVPALSSTFGPLDVQMAPTMGRLQQNDTRPTNFQEPASQTITTHLNLANGVFMYDYNPRDPPALLQCQCNSSPPGVSQ